jgi:hypothetical protein
MPSNRVRAVQERRRSNAAGPHRPRKGPNDEPCVCGTEFTCLANVHDDDRDEPTATT